MTERALATVRRIAEIREIPNADRIVGYRVDGWWVVDQRDRYKVGELVIYAEPDSWVPHTLAPFLTKPGAFPKVFNNAEGQRLRTIKLKGQYSQGLLLELGVALDYFVDSKYDEGQELSEFFFEGNDVTELLGIMLWEKPEELRSANAKGNFPNFLRKTECIRIQNYGKEILKDMEDSTVFQISEKVDGSSCSIFIKDGEIGVCSRNLELKDEENVTFWKVAKSQGLVQYLQDLQEGSEPINIALQGELLGPGIQGNSYGLDKHVFFLYDIFKIDEQVYMDAQSVQGIALCSNLLHVPVLGYFKLADLFKPESITSEMLEMAEGNSVVGIKPKREGLVFKSMKDTNVSIKSISQSWLYNNDKKD